MRRFYLLAFPSFLGSIKTTIVVVGGGRGGDDDGFGTDGSFRAQLSIACYTHTIVGSFVWLLMRIQ